jgi:hypothetical protein
VSSEKDKPGPAPKTPEETTGALNRAFRRATESGEKAARKKAGKKGPVGEEAASPYATSENVAPAKKRGGKK